MKTKEQESAREALRRALRDPDAIEPGPDGLKPGVIRSVLRAVAECADDAGEGANPSQASLAASTGWASTTVRRALAELVRQQWLEVTKPASPASPAVYAVRVPVRGRSRAAADAEADASAALAEALAAAIADAADPYALAAAIAAALARRA
jgi:hypothetical protein